MAKQLKHVVLAGVFSLASAAGLMASSFAQSSSRNEAPLPARGSQYYSDAMALARILGRAHAIRVTCNGRSDQFWRLYMQEMLDLEAPNRGGLRDSMARAFNDAYSSEASRRTFCDAVTVEAEALFAADGKVLAERLARHYFNR